LTVSCQAVEPQSAATAAPGKSDHKLLDVYRANPSSPDDHQAEAGLNDYLVFVVSNLATWSPALQASPKIVPYINGIAIRGDYPVAIDTSRNTVTFKLKRIQDAKVDNREAWSVLLRRPRPSERTRLVQVSLGTEDGREVLPLADTAASDGNLALVVLPWWSWLLALLLLVIIGALVYFGIESDILRDSDLEPFNKGDRRPYSLARTQMAVWFAIIVASYVTLWAITGELGNIPDTVLGLMGISAGTAVAAVSIDASRRVERQKTLAIEKKKLDDQIVQLKGQIAAPAAGADIASLQADLLRTNEKLDALNPRSRNFFIDILSDVEGVTLHRFQMAAWTLVLTFIFLATVYNALAMPEFSGTLLGLMGISAGAYLGFKAPEQKV
jgi:hypothetical protein